MRRIFLPLLALCLLCPIVVWAIGMDIGNGPINTDGGPKGLADLVNKSSRVHGYFVNSASTFFFKGDTATLNDFLVEYSTLGTNLHVVIHPGTTEVRSPWDKAPRDIAADWRLSVMPLAADGPLRDVDKPFTYVTRVDVWLGGAVKLDALRVPRDVIVDSGGEIEMFVEEHRKAAERIKHG